MRGEKWIILEFDLAPKATYSFHDSKKYGDIDEIGK
jgi:hypothetical protein